MAIHQLAGNRTRDEKEHGVRKERERGEELQTAVDGAGGKEFSNSSGRVRMSSRTKLKCSDELANQLAGEAYEQQVKTPRKEPDGTGEVL